MADVLVRWDRVTTEDDERWSWRRVLYGYLAPPHGEIVYIGKADYCSVYERWTESAKPKMWAKLDAAGIRKHCLIVGDIELPRGRRLSVALLGDVESLLIYSVQPSANTACRRLRITRPG